jgi:hypothetical protein
MVDVLGYQPMKTGKASVYMPSRMDVKFIPDLRSLLENVLEVAISPAYCRIISSVSKWACCTSALESERSPPNARELYHTCWS